MEILEVFGKGGILIEFLCDCKTKLRIIPQKKTICPNCKKRWIFVMTVIEDGE